MNTENYRLIPNKEYKRLVGLANLHEKAIREVVGKTLAENKEEYKTIFRTIRDLRGSLLTIERQLEGIIDFCKPYYSAPNMIENWVKLMDEYIKKINR